MELARYSIGVGDRFGRQGAAQLRALAAAAVEGIEVVPVWNKSNREHGIIGTDAGRGPRARRTPPCRRWGGPGPTSSMPTTSA